MDFKGKILVAASLVTSATGVFAQNKNWVVQSSTIQFDIKNAGLTVKGTFSGLQATIAFHPQQVEKAVIKGSLKTSSINTGITMRDNHLRKPDFFDAAQFPTIALEAVSITKIAEGSFNGSFKLTIKDITKVVTIPFVFAEKGEKAAISGYFSLNRRDYGVGGSSFTMSDTVNIKVSAVLSEK